MTENPERRLVKNTLPAKKRYDEKHPVVSYRVSREEYDRLKEVLAKQDKTMKEFFREALGLEERNYKEARKAGYRRGFKDAKEKYAVHLYCVGCGEEIALMDENVKKAIAEEYLTVVHEGCGIPDHIDTECVTVLGRR
jgi:flagellar biosynthesis/type III secretory pathway protein FliH